MLCLPIKSPNKNLPRHTKIGRLSNVEQEHVLLPTIKLANFWHIPQQLSFMLPCSFFKMEDEYLFYVFYFVSRQ